MIISTYAKDYKQGLLFDQPIKGHGHARTVIGDLIEELSVCVLNGRRHRTDSRADYCPDISTNQGYFECKAAGLSNQTFIYGGRLVKDSKFVTDGNKKNHYHFEIYNAPANNQTSLFSTPPRVRSTDETVPGRNAC